MYPNPANSVLNVDGVSDIRNIQIVSISGSVVADVTGTSTINVADLKEGLYLIRIFTAKEVLSTTFVKE